MKLEVLYFLFIDNNKWFIITTILIKKKHVGKIKRVIWRNPDELTQRAGVIAHMQVRLCH